MTTLFQQYKVFEEVFQTQLGDIKMNKLTKTILASSAALLMVVSTNSYSDSIGDRIEEAGEDRADRLEDRADRVREANKNARERM